MTKRIYRGILLSSVITMLACLIFTIGIQYQMYDESTKDALKDKAYIISLNSESGDLSKYADAKERITLITSSGNVLFDNKAIADKMENHLSRKEVTEALDSGADDYVAKPFGTMELISRIKALLRRTKNEETEYNFGRLYVNPTKHIVTVGGENVSLTLKEFEILCLMLKNRGTVLSRDRLLTEIWGYDYDGENRTIDVHIKTLRTKLKDCGALIETVRGLGYKIG